jgi:hypothetical protein
MTGSIGLLGMANWGGMMGSATTVLRVADIDAPLAQAWDELPAGRGIQADHYDSYAWLAAWCSIADAATVASVRIPAVLDGDRPLALLPLVARSRRRWASSWQGASRLRHRPVLGTEQPEQEPLGLLADEVARTGVRELTLRLPARDPATGAMATALRQAASTCISASGPASTWRWSRAAGPASRGASRVASGRPGSWPGGCGRCGR